MHRSARAQADLDANASLDLDELKAALKNPQHADTAFANLDSNMDGKISLREWLISMHDTFTKSEAACKTCLKAHEKGAHSDWCSLAPPTNSFPDGRVRDHARRSHKSGQGETGSWSQLTNVLWERSEAAPEAAREQPRAGPARPRSRRGLTHALTLSTPLGLGRRCAPCRLLYV